MPLWRWSQTSATNASADPTINFAEGQAPSSVNDSARAMMAATAKFRDDIAGAIATAGTSTAYTVASFSVFDSLAHMDKQMIAFVPHATNGATVTLNIDGLGAKPLRSAPSIELLAGTIIQGTPYVATYNNTDGAFYLRNFFGNPYNIPLGGGMDYWLPTAPNSSFVFPFGQAISRTTYATLFAAMGSTYGSGDGSTTFNLPDKRGRVSATPDNMGGGSDPSRLASGSLAGVRNSIGGAGGADTITLSTAQIPTHVHGITDPGHHHATAVPGSVVAFAGGALAANAGTPAAVNSDTQVTGITTTNGNTGGNGAHDNLQPTILCNYILRVI